MYFFKTQIFKTNFSPPQGGSFNSWKCTPLNVLTADWILGTSFSYLPLLHEGLVDEPENGIAVPSPDTPKAGAGAPWEGAGAPRVGGGGARIGAGSPREGAGAPRLGAGAPRAIPWAPEAGPGAAEAGPGAPSADPGAPSASPDAPREDPERVGPKTELDTAREETVETAPRDDTPGDPTWPGPPRDGPGAPRDGPGAPNARLGVTNDPCVPIGAGLVPGGVQWLLKEKWDTSHTNFKSLCLFKALRNASMLFARILRLFCPRRSDDNWTLSLIYKTGAGRHNTGNSQKRRRITFFLDLKTHYIFLKKN